MAWLATAGGYQVSLQSGEVACRNAAGRTLKSVPPAIREDPVVVGLRQLTEWLARHEASCRTEVERWMVRSLPVPAAVLRSVWPDESWRTALTDLVVAVPDADGAFDPDEVGFLRDVDGSGIGVVNLDGETLRIPANQLLIPHPVLLADLEELREFAADLGVAQSVDQLFRATWSRPATLDPESRRLDGYSGGTFAELRHLLARAAAHGYPVRGGYAVCRVFEAGRTVEARYWVGSEDPSWETETGDLVFTDRAGTGLRLGEVGPVAWSEGVRMAAALYAGRVVEKPEDGE
ncbi:MAG: hypothetical protein AUI14_15260 [Actinobacteria bacterium 13_2_20CM_2_71_6]|nr:MAG: hypothetical protein AUI14_15260 [Actinobacteria bacterium 13_2_20CM_2_71_6]